MKNEHHNIEYYDSYRHEDRTPRYILPDYRLLRLLDDLKTEQEENQKLRERLKAVNRYNYELMEAIDSCDGDCSYYEEEDHENR